MIRDHYRNTDIRKAELDPSTFAHPEEWQREPRDGRLAVASWLAAILIGALIWAGVIWAAIAIFK